MGLRWYEFIRRLAMRQVRAPTRRAFLRALMLVVGPPVAAVVISILAYRVGGSEERCFRQVECPECVVCSLEVQLLFDTAVFGLLQLLIVLPIALIVARGVRTGRVSARAPRRVVIALLAVVAAAVGLIIADAMRFGLGAAVWSGVMELGLPASVLVVLAMRLANPSTSTA